MDKNNAILEITSNSLKLIIGYVLDGKDYVLYALSTPIPDGIIVEGKIADYPALVKEIRKIASIKDPSAKLKINISDVTLCLPPYGLQVFNTDKVTTVVSEDSRVTMLDIRNIHALISKEPVPSSNVIVDIIPEEFVLDQGRLFKNPPINEISNTITMHAKMHTLPRVMVNDFENAVCEAGIHVSRTIVSAFGAIEFLGGDPELPTDYFLLDIGAKVSVVSLAGQKQLFSSTSFNWGGDNITAKIAEKFQISFEEAEKYKQLYGFDNRELSFSPTVCKVEDENGNVISHSLKELQLIIKSEIDEFISLLNQAETKLLEGYKPSYRELPLIMIGGGSLLTGLKKYVEPKITNSKIYCPLPKVVGARNPGFYNCLGVMNAAAKYQSVYDDTHPKISSVSRNKN